MIIRQRDLLPHHHQTIGFWIGQRPKKHGINQGENGGIRAHAESDREHNNSSEAGVFAEHARTEAQVLPQNLKEWKTAPVAVDFFGLFDAAEFHEGLAPCFWGAQAGAQIVFDVHLEMAFHLGGEFALASLLAEESAEAQQPCSDYSHNALRDSPLLLKCPSSSYEIIRNATPPSDRHAWRGVLGPNRPGCPRSESARRLRRTSKDRWTSRRTTRWRLREPLRTRQRRR